MFAKLLWREAIAKRSPSLKVHRDSPLRVSRGTVYHKEDTHVRGTRHTCKRARRAEQVTRRRFQTKPLR